MSGFLADSIVILVLVVMAALAVRSLWRSHNSGGSCSGDCSHCKSCHHK